MSTTTKINCPNCNTEIDVNNIIAHQLEETYKKKYQQDALAQRKNFEEKKKKLLKKKRKKKTKFLQSV
jgi:hypothetical protein